MRLLRSAAAAALFLSVFGLASPAPAVLIDIVVIGTWEAANSDPTINPFGLVAGDRFVMRATYDDTTLFNGSEGVTATIDPTVNAGTSFDVVIPHAAGAPNPLEFDHGDHTDIGFAPNAQIEFDGGDATTDPGSFRNFEIHVDFTFGGQNMDFDTFFGGATPETDIFNISQGGSAAARSITAGHLQVVTNDLVADAGGPYVFDAGNLSLTLSGSATGGNSFGNTFSWSQGGGALPGSPGQNISFSLADAALSNTLDSSTVDLSVVESFTLFADGDSALVSYANADPSILAAGGVANPDDSITFSATTDDVDLAANALVSGFESLTLEFLFGSSVFLTGGGTLDLASLLAVFGGPGTFSVDARVTDLAGATDVQSFDITVVPEPGTWLLLGLGVAWLAAGGRRLAG